jgi:polyisoprenoid-binding protein YceI
MRSSLVAFLLLVASPAAAQTPRTFAVGGRSEVSYKIVHKLHTVTGRSGEVSGKARLLPDGGVQAMVRVAVASFDSGNANRDAHLKEVTEVHKFPIVEFKGVASALAMPARYPLSVEVPMRGAMTFHGVERAVQVNVEARFPDPDHLEIAARIPLSLEAFGIERPSLLFVKIDDEAVIEAKLSLVAER